ncbi:hypothetical protein ABIB25_005491 [Nakamurella sp. UYEF19]|uniref:hypothetical protein n=1 Tax=Nakamurella sp. UYEF19 TaxID=1756392 RepID=UPI003392B6AE
MAEDQDRSVDIRHRPGQLVSITQPPIRSTSGVIPMLFFLIDVLMIALVITGWHHDPAVGPGPHTQSAHNSTDTAVDTPERQPTGAVRLPHRSTVRASLQRGSRGPVRPGEFTGNEIPEWTALDDHQLTRLLKQFSP